MKRYSLLIQPVILAFFIGMLFLLSCTYDATPFKRLEEQPTCPKGLFLCDGVCVTLDTKQRCGTCSNVCTHDRLCEKKGDVYQCACPGVKVNCGENLSCFSLDGLPASDPRCGNCNTLCLTNEVCQEQKCVCRLNDGKILSDDEGDPLSGEDLLGEYLKNDDHCGFCGNKCEGVGVHCVLGQCTKTECGVDKNNKEECHFSLPDGREECQACEQNCMSKSDLGVGQTALVPKIEDTEVMLLIDARNFSPDAYIKGKNGAFKLKRVAGCACMKDDLTTVTCEADKADRCNNGVCVCAANDTGCVDGTTCTSDGCHSTCDELNRACPASITCKDHLCHCPDAETQENSKNYAHCIDGLKCSAGKCYCPTPANGDDECGVRGDHCTDKNGCVCGVQATTACQGDAICKLGQCVCTLAGEVCDKAHAPDCVGNACVCGTSSKSKPCTADEVCVDGQCKCAKDAACKLEGTKTPKTDRCDEGRCVCGTTGAACPGKSICTNGNCLCTEDDDCPKDEKCDKASGQCRCGEAKGCMSEATCKDGYCQCDGDGACHDGESCVRPNGFDYICVCDSDIKQKACKIGAICTAVEAKQKKKCMPESELENACFRGEQVSSLGYCVCGQTDSACRPGYKCDKGKCDD